MARKADIEFFRGNDQAVRVTLDPVVNCNGWAITSTVRINPLSPNALITKTATITDGTNGIFTVTILDTDTNGLTPGKYSWDAKRTDDGLETTLVYGTLTLLAEVTR